MSGTSADALDAALVDFDQKIPTLIGTQSISLPAEIKQKVHRLAIDGNNEMACMRELDNDIALISSAAVNNLCKEYSITAQSITAIGSHGQTLRHYPANAQQPGYSLQVGDPNIIAEETGITTVADFRRRDIAAGGQGAPLTPAFHKAIFHSSHNDRIILNTGGIANISYIPSNGSTVGYDTGPANALMDSWCQEHKQQRYDKGGEWARSGKINSPLLAQLLTHPYFSQASPKSTGRETFNLPWLKEQIELFGHINAEDIQATLLALTVESIALEIESKDQNAIAEVYICGGGSHNIALTESLTKRLHPRKFQSTNTIGIHPDWVEAIAFAWLAKQTMEHAVGNLPEVTGAKREVILGGIYLGH